MKPLYAMTNGFLEVVQPSYETFDKLREKGINISDYENLGAITDKLIDTFTKDWGFWAQYMIGYLICIIIGLLFIVVMIFTGIIFCCCRCCGKCGGRVNPQERKNARCMRICCGISLFLLNSIMVAGMIMAFMSNELLRQQTAREPRAALPTIGANLHSIDLYKDNSIQAIRTGIFERLTKKTDVVIGKVTDFPLKAQDTVSQLTDAEKILGIASDLAESVTRINSTLHNVKHYSEELQTQGQALSTSLNTWKTDVKASLATCTDKNTECEQLDSEVDALGPDANFQNLGDVSQPLNRVKQVVDGDLGQLILKSEEEFNKIRQNVQNNATQQITDAVEKVLPDVEKEAEKFKKNVKKAIDDFEKKANQFNLNGTRNEIRKVEPLVETYGNYRWYVGITLSCILLLIILFYYLGLAFGACGEPPYEDASTCNKGVGANLLMAGVGFTFIFCWILMLLTLVLFLGGGLTYTEVCRHAVKVEDSNIVSEANKFVASILKGADIPLDFDIAEVMRGCKNDESIYHVLKLDTILNITEVLDLDNWGIRDLIEEIGKVNFELGNIDILDATTRSQLETLANANLDGISFTSFTNELIKAVTNQDLIGLINQIKVLAEDFGISPTATQLEQHLAELQNIQDNQVVPIQQNMQKLSDSVQELEDELDSTRGSKTFQDYTEDLLQQYDAASKNIEVNATKIVISFLKDEALEIYEDFRQFILQVSGDVQNEIGRCRPVYEALSSSIDTACVNVLNPFNGFWFSMGWCLVFFIPSLIVAVKLVTLYRKTEEYDGPETKSFDDPNFDAYTGVYPGDNIPLEDIDRKKHYRNGRGHQNTAYDRDDYSANHQHSNYYHRDNSYNQSAPGYTTYDRQGYSGDGYGGTNTPPNPPHYYNNRNRMY